MELLKQPQYSPYPVEEQVVSVWLGTTGQLDDIAVEDVRLFEQDFLTKLRSGDSVLGTIRETGQFADDTEAALQSELDAFKRGYVKDSDTSVHHAGHEENEAIPDEDVHQEQIVKQKRG